MTGLADAVAITKASFVDQLLGKGFRRASPEDLKDILDVDLLAEYDKWPYDDIDDDIRTRLKGNITEAAAQAYMVGEVTTESSSNHPVVVGLGDGFPFSPPDVFARHDFPRSWHRNRDGTICLYPLDDRGGLPWLAVEGFLELVQRWFHESENGWQSDFPLLDIEAYIPRSSTERRLVLYSDLARLTWVKFQVDARTIRLEGSGRRASRALALPSATRFGFVTNIGEPVAPPRDWDDLARAIGRRASAVKRAILAGEISILLVRYQRDEHSGVLVLEVGPESIGDGVEIASLRGASSSVQSAILRAGEFAQQLREKRVLVVGAGAVGSHVADYLARAGIGSLGVMDFDDVKPGNLIRHLATDRHVGWSKATAVRDVIVSRLFNITDVEAFEAILIGPEHASAALRGYDLVVDATANGSVTALLHHAAAAEGGHVLSVCIKENGAIARVDILPPLKGEPLPEPEPSHPGSVSVGYEAGCYAAVSLTPHAAVAEAAALTVRTALDLLLGNPVAPAGIERDYR